MGRFDKRPRAVLARAVIVFIAFMLVVYAVGLWLNINTQNMLRRQILQNTQLQLTYLANSFERELEHLYRQQLAFGNDFGLRLLMLYPDLSEMGSILTQLRRINIHINTIYMSSSHVSGVGFFFPNLDRITRWGATFAPLTGQDRLLINAIQTSDRLIFPHEQDLLIGIPLSWGAVITPGTDGAVSYVRLSGESIRNTLNYMAQAYDMNIALYSGAELVLSTDPGFDGSLRELNFTENEPYFFQRSGESMWLLRAPLNQFDFELVALFPITQVDETVLPTMIGTFALFILALIGGTICFTLYISRLIRQIYNERRASEKAQLGQLHLQITPHFLYNSFYQIYRLVKLGDADTVSELSLKLSQFYQYITRSRDDAVTLALELKHAEDYAAIQSIRHAGQIECSFDPIPEQIKEMKMPKLFLQPLIENAYIHGMDNSNGALLIHTGIVYENGIIIISVEDNGTNLIDANLLRVKEKLTGIGTSEELTSLVNISQRLAFMFGSDAAMTAERSKMGGLKIEIKISQ